MPECGVPFSSILMRSGKQAGTCVGLQGAGEGGKGLPLPRQRSQSHLLGPVYSQLSKPCSPEKPSPHPSWVTNPDPAKKAGQQPVPREGLSRSHPTSSSEATWISPSPGVRGTQRDGGGQVGALLEASFLFSHVGQDTPLCSQSYLLLVITIPLTPTQSQMVLTVCQAIHIPDQTLMESSRGSVVGPRLQMRKPRLTKKRPWPGRKAGE